MRDRDGRREGETNRQRERETKEKTPYSVREARTKDEFETDDLSPSRERRHERKRESGGEVGGRETRGKEGRERDEVRKELLGKTPLVDRALDDCLAFRSSVEGKGGEITRFRNHLVRAAIDRRCQFSN